VCPTFALAGALGFASLANAEAPAAATQTKRSTAADRKKVAITVYNQNFGLVREVRTIDLGAAGKSSLEVSDVAATIQPETVAMKTTGSGTLDVLEQNYRYDLLTPQTMLEKYVGKKIRAYRYNKTKGADDGYDATLVSAVDGRPILEIDGRITADFPGRLAFPGVPDNLISRPTLVWLLDSKEAKQEVEVTYMASGMGWNADYVLVVNDDDTKADLSGWVTLRNESGASYEQAELKLVAGDVNRVTRNGPMDYKPKPDEAQKAEDGSAFSEEALFEYHLYTLAQPTDVLDREQKQVTLLTANGVQIQKRMMFRGQSYWYRGRYGQILSNAKVGVFLDIQNSEKQGLGMPLPKGAVRVYKEDKSKARQFIGEDSIDHTPRDEKVHVKMGDAFDVVGDRKQTSFTELGGGDRRGCVVESEWEIEIRNHKDKAVTVEDWEPIDGDWEILSSSQPSTKKDAHTFVFDIAVPANGKKTVTYKVRVKYC